MVSPLTKLIRFGASLAVIGVIATNNSSPAMSWSGHEEIHDGVTHVLNPAMPAMASETISPEELWRIGGDDDEDIIFGVLSSIGADGAGNLYLLDSQLSQVMVFSPDGELLRTIGREGEGPGEFRRAGDLFFTPRGELAVMQRMPGRIVLLTTEGEPAGLFPLPEELTGGPVHFGGGALAGNDVVIATRQFARRETGFEVTHSLIRVTPDGRKAATYFERSARHDMANFVFDERKDAEVLWTADARGNVYTNDNFDAYSINVFQPDGSLARVIEREYEHRKRSAQEKEDNRPRVMIRHGNRRVEADAKVSDTDRDVLSLFTRDDGTLWVLSSRGANDTASGVIATFDVYDAAGRFQRQVMVRGEGNYSDDGIHFVGDRLFVVLGLRSAQSAMRGGEDGEEVDEEDARPMAVICYDIGGIVEAGR
ncbi:MAG: hypothetical protein IH969_09820 [Candidatus Krumholzibacteriota bacterium]|nr:hypothetical protein [Candidatus Krumholzibacteriota bacterium]